VGEHGQVCKTDGLFSDTVNLPENTDEELAYDFLHIQDFPVRNTGIAAIFLSFFLLTKTKS